MTPFLIWPKAFLMGFMRKELKRKTRRDEKVSKRKAMPCRAKAALLNLGSI